MIQTQTPIEFLLSEAKLTRPPKPFSEGSDPRVVAGALAASKAGIACVILVDSTNAIRAELQVQEAAKDGGVAIRDPTTLMRAT